MTTNLCSGRLTKWNDERGFGFIQPVDKGQTVYLHISELKNSTRRPQLNDTIYYYVIAEEDGKLRADNAFILGARKKPILSSISLIDK
jgi:cold shock CspA family protein